MKKVFLGAFAMIVAVYATDFSSMSTQDLANMRGSVATEEREAFKNEMQSRMSSMSPEERATYSGANKNTASDSAGGNGTKQRVKDGSGSGSGGANKGSRNGSNGNGNGNGGNGGGQR